MRRSFMVGILLLAGCTSVVGPRQRGLNTTRVDNPCLTIDEQKRQARDRLAFPQDTPVLPGTGAGIPTNVNR